MLPTSGGDLGCCNIQDGVLCDNSLTIIAKHSILNVGAALDPPQNLIENNAVFTKSSTNTCTNSRCYDIVIVNVVNVVY